MTEDDGEVDEDFPALDKKVRTIPKMTLCKVILFIVSTCKNQFYTNDNL